MTLTLTKTSNLTALFNIIHSAKNIREYSIANAAFTCLLDEVLDRDDIKIQYESQLDYKYSKKVKGVIECDVFVVFDTWEYSGEPYTYKTNTYYDLITISDGLRDVCIPVPLLKPRVALACFEDARQRRNFIEKRKHNRSHSPKLPGQFDYLLKELEKINPNWRELASKYLAEDCLKSTVRGLTPLRSPSTHKTVMYISNLVAV